MDANLDKITHHSPQRAGEVTSSSRKAPYASDEKIEVFEPKNLQKKEAKRVKEDKKSHEFATVSLLYGEKQTKPPKSITIHSFHNNFDLSFITKSEALFSRYVKMQAKIIEQTIKVEREAKYHEAHWQAIKKAFHARLNELNKMKGKS